MLSKRAKAARIMKKSYRKLGSHYGSRERGGGVTKGVYYAVEQITGVIETCKKKKRVANTSTAGVEGQN